MHRTCEDLILMKDELINWLEELNNEKSTYEKGAFDADIYNGVGFYFDVSVEYF